MKKFVVLVTGLVLMFTPWEASAHAVDVYQGNDRGWINSDHSKFGAQDRECDGHSVTTEVSFGDFTTGWVTDANGCASGGSQASTNGKKVIGIRVCEDAATYSCSFSKDA